MDEVCCTEDGARRRLFRDAARDEGIAIGLGIP
jgi:hypothetical protein